MTTVRENLIAAKALIDTPEEWGKGTTDPITPPEFGLCAMNVCAQIAPGTVMEFELYHVLKSVLPDGPWLDDDIPIAAFNDNPTTTHADIMALFDRAVASLPLNAEGGDK